MATTDVKPDVAGVSEDADQKDNVAFYLECDADFVQASIAANTGRIADYFERQEKGEQVVAEHYDQLVNFAESAEELLKVVLEGGQPAFIRTQLQRLHELARQVNGHES